MNAIPWSHRQLVEGKPFVMLRGIADVQDLNQKRGPQAPRLAGLSMFPE